MHLFSCYTCTQELRYVTQSNLRGGGKTYIFPLSKNTMTNNIHFVMSYLFISI